MRSIANELREKGKKGEVEGRPMPWPKGKSVLSSCYLAIELRDRGG